MAEENKHNKSEIERPKFLKKFVIAFILGTFIFISIFALGYTISYSKLQSIYKSQGDLRYQLLSFQVETELLEDNCDSFNPYRFTEEMDRIGKIIGILEERIGKEDSKVLEQKKTYSLLEVQHFLYIREHNKKCENDFPTILFFYSNKEASKDESERLGYMLTTLKNKMPNLMIYSFDYYLDSSIISLLKEKYNITAPNTLVINEKIKIENLEELQNIEKLL